MIRRPTRWPSRRTIIAGAIGSMMTLAAAAAAGAAWIWAGRMADPRATDTFHVSDFPALKFEPITFVSQTGVTLSGRFFPGQGGATIVLTHGYGGSEDVSRALEAGYDAHLSKPVDMDRLNQVIEGLCLERPPRADEP